MKERSYTLDLIRGIAALLVMAGHLRSIFFVPYEQSVNQGILAKVFYLITGYGHECVIVFFVLSGFLVGGSFLHNLSGAGLDNRVKSYFLSRLTRLWVVLLPAILLTLVLDTVGAMLASNPEIYTSRDYFTFIHPSNDRSAAAFFGNIFFVQTLLVDTFGTNSPLWSLSNEFWYYVMFPLLCVPFLKVPILPWKIMAVNLLIAIVLSMIVLNEEMASGFLIWLAGVAAWQFRMSAPKRIYTLAGVVVFVGIFLAARVQKLPYPDLFIGLGSALLIITSRELSTRIAQVIAEFLSRISFTLYLVHLPIIIFIKAVVFPDLQLHGSLMDFVMWIVMAGAVVLLSWLLYLPFERNTDRIRRWIKSR